MITNLPSQTDLSGFYIVYEGSTLLEKKGWYGISHLLEHLVFKSVDHLQDDYDRAGLEYNAYTSSNEVVFYLTGLDHQVVKFRDQFLDLLLKFQITEEQLEMEKQIVLSEYEDYFNEQSQNHQMNWARKFLGDADPIGLKEDIENIKHSDVKEFFELQYSKPTKIINVGKTPFNRSDIKFISSKFLKEFSYGDYDLPLELGNSFKDKTSIIFASPIIKENPAINHFINSMLGLGLRSPLYDEVREKKGLVYSIHCYQSRLNLQGINCITTQTSNKNVKEVVKTIEYVLSNPDKFLTQERFDIIKDYYQNKYQKSEIMRYKNIGSLIEPEGWSLEKELDNITYDKVIEQYDKYYQLKDWQISLDKDMKK
jgi:predicted Zn-dependent peptidase